MNRFIKTIPSLAIMVTFAGYLYLLTLGCSAQQVETYLSNGIKLFILSFSIGIISIPAGISGGVLFLPAAGLIFPYHIDIIRGTSVIMSLIASLSSTPSLMKNQTASLPVALTISLFTVSTATIGAMVGLAVDRNLVRLVIGIVIIMIALIMLLQKNEGHNIKEAVPVTKSPLAMGLFSVSGFMAGLLGLGTGWANTPLLNMVLRYPLVNAAATSMIIITITVSGSAMVYLSSGSVVPVIVVPVAMGMYAGSRLATVFLGKWRPSFLKKVVILVLALAGAMSILRALQG